MKEEDGFTFAFDSVSFSDTAGKTDDKEIFCLFNDEQSEAICVWISEFEGSLYPNASKTDGMRLGGAIVRAYADELEGLDEVNGSTLASAATNGILTVSKVKLPKESKGDWAWRWSIKKA